MGAKVKGILCDGRMSDIYDAGMQYWDERPCNAWHALNGSWLERSQEYTRRKKFNEPHIWKWTEFERWTNASVLVLGCGIGTQTLEFARNGAYITAIDYSHQSLFIARERAKAEGLDMQIRFIEGNIEEPETYKVLTPHYRLIYSFGVLHHTPHPEKALQEALKYVNPNGANVYLMLYNRLSWKWLYHFWKHGKDYDWDFERTVREFSEAQRGCPLTTTWTKSSAYDLLIGCGVLPYDSQIDHIFRWDGPAYGRGEYVVARPWRGMPEWMFHLCERLIGQHLLVKAHTIKGVSYADVG